MVLPGIQSYTCRLGETKLAHSSAPFPCRKLQWQQLQGDGLREFRCRAWIAQSQFKLVDTPRPCQMDRVGIDSTKAEQLSMKTFVDWAGVLNSTTNGKTMDSSEGGVWRLVSRMLVLQRLRAGD